MANITPIRIQIGKGVAVDGVTKQTFYGDDFNPNLFQRPDNRDQVTASEQTTNFDLTYFSAGHEVGTCVAQFDCDTAWSGTIYADFIRDGVVGWYITWQADFSGTEEWAFYMYFGVDKDEIRPGYSTYRIHRYTVDGSLDAYSPTFTVSNLSFDDSYHDSGYIWVDGANLCYTDNTGDESGRDGEGFKHRIAYDSSYSESVGSDKAGHIWLEPSDNLRIYYVDQYGTKRRTYPSKEWYGGNTNVGSSNSGKMWVGVWSQEYGYGYLCFITPNGNKRRILNGPPGGY